MSIYLGIDPGANGGMAALTNKLVYIQPLSNLTLQETYHLLQAWTMDEGKIIACMEQQDPRPTKWFSKEGKKWMSSILRSTCILYGNYCKMEALLVALEAEYVLTPAKRWQSGLNIKARAKKETNTSWKNRLKTKAQQLFPKQRVTLAICDALLIAEYTRREHLRNSGKNNQEEE